MTQPRELILANIRLEQANQCLASAIKLLEFGDSRGAVNRAYYAIFHGMRSVLVLQSKDFAKHSAVISYFRREYVKPGIFSTDLSDTITTLFNTRSSSDYSDTWELTDEDVKALIEEAKNFIEAITKYHENNIGNNTNP